MDKITRQQFLDRLQNNWQDYAARFHHLAPADQKAFLVKQGYANLAGLLGHIVAWWQSGVEPGLRRGQLQCPGGGQIRRVG